VTKDYRRRILHYVRARWRYVVIATRGFKVEAAIGILIIIVGGYLIHWWHPQKPGFSRSLHAALALLALQNELDYPEPRPGEPLTAAIRVIQVLWFVLPIVGVTVVAETLVRLSVVVFNREQGREEWKVAVASTMRDHVVVIGFGRIGWRVVGQIAPRDPRIVVVETSPKEEFGAVLERYDIPLIQGDARRDDVLEKANVRLARTIMALTNDDLVNIEVALNAREINPDIKVVLRMFDEHLADRIERAFDFQAVFSTTALAAPSFAAAVWNQKILHSMNIGEDQLHLARFVVARGSSLVGQTIAHVEARHAVNVLLHQREGQKDLLPAAGNVVGPHDALYIVGGLEGIDGFDALAGGARARQTKRGRALADEDRRRMLARRIEAFYEETGDALERGERYQSRAKGRALAFLEPQPGQRILEVGVGTGGLFARIATRLGPSGWLVGVDTAESLLRRTRARLSTDGGRGTLLRGDATRLPFGDESFDRVITTYVLDLLEEDAILDALAEMRRVLRPGGVVVCAGLTARGASPSGRVTAHVYRLVRQVLPLSVGGCRPIDLEPFARRAGLRVVRREVIEQKGRASEVVACVR
jgi:ubiquinone/menaquinone biosynthesis C-methylase UbiE/Trk K+ transport system NAD-binding subunit